MRLLLFNSFMTKKFGRQLFHVRKYMLIYLEITGIARFFRVDLSQWRLRRRSGSERSAQMNVDRLFRPEFDRLMAPGRH